MLTGSCLAFLKRSLISLNLMHLYCAIVVHSMRILEILDLEEELSTVVSKQAAVLRVMCHASVEARAVRGPH